MQIFGVPAISISHSFTSKYAVKDTAKFTYLKENAGKNFINVQYTYLVLIKEYFLSANQLRQRISG